jgi:hypothetical protein
MATVETFEVLEIEPHFANPPRVSPFRSHERIQMNKAASEIVQFRGEGVRHRLFHEFLFNNRTDFGEFADFFFDRKGKWGGFWVPSWHEELKATAGITAAATTISIDPVDFAEVYLNDGTAPATKLGTYLWIYHEDGAFEYLKVTGATAADPEVLTLDASTPIAQTASLGSFVIGFLYFVRFMADEIPFAFPEPNSCKFSIGFLEVARYQGEDDATAQPFIYEFFEDYPLGSVSDPSTLTAGVGWNTPTDVVPNRTASVARDFFDAYSVGPFVSVDWSSGVFWSAAGDITSNRKASAGFDSFESYSVGAIIGSSVNAGSGWTGTTSIVTNT